MFLDKQILLSRYLLLPRPFNDTFNKPFVNTTNLPSDSNANVTITAARNASFIAYDEEFLSIIGEKPEVKLLATSGSPDDSFAFEGGIWVPEQNQVWFTAFLNPTPGYLSILDLNTSTVFRPNITGAVLPNPNGGYNFNGKVNSYFGLPLNGPDDVTVAVSRKTGAQCMFFTDFFFNEEGLQAGTFQGPSQLPYFVWRYTPADQNLRTVIGPLDIQVPNGIAVDRTNPYLYVTDGPAPSVFESAPNHTLPTFAGIYKYNLGGEDGCTPVNKQLFAFGRQGFANGVKVDDSGRVWTAEYEGIVVRNGTTAKVLGLFNAQDIVLNNHQNPVDVRDVAPVANFALAGDQLVILAFNRIFGVKLAEAVMCPDRFRLATDMQR